MRIPATVVVNRLPRQALLKSYGDQLAVYGVGNSQPMRTTVTMSPKAMVNFAINVLRSEIVPEERRLSIEIPRGRAPISGKLSDKAFDALTREERLAKLRARHLPKADRRSASESLVCPLGMARGIKVGEFMIGFDPTRDILWWNSSVVAPQDLIDACEWVVSDWLAQSEHPSLALPWVPVSERVELVKPIAAPTDEELLNGPHSNDPLDELRKLHPDASGVRLQQIRDGLLELSFREREIAIREEKVSQRERQVADDRELIDASMHDFDVREALSKEESRRERELLAKRHSELDEREAQLDARLLALKKREELLETGRRALKHQGFAEMTSVIQQLEYSGGRAALVRAQRLRVMAGRIGRKDFDEMLE